MPAPWFIISSREVNMWILALANLAATIPQGWPMFRYDQARTGFCPARANFSSMPQTKAEWIVWDEGDIVYASPVGADFNSDGWHDVLVGSYGMMGYPITDVYRGYNGSMIWASPVYTSEGCYHGSPALMDVNDDLIPEVFVPIVEFGALYALNGANGSMLWAAYIGTDYYSSPLVTEEDFGGRVYVCNDLGVLYCMSATTGSVLWSHIADFGGTCYSAPSAGDVNGDGQDELVYTCGTVLYVVSSSGTELWNTSTGDIFTSTAALVDRDGDGDSEMWVYCGGAGYIKVFEYGNPTPVINVFVGSSAGILDWPPPPAVADVNADGVPDAVMHHYNGVTMIDGVSGLVAWNTFAQELYGPVIMANLDFDTTLEIIAVGRPPYDYYRCKVEMYQDNGSLAWQWWTSGPYDDEVEGEAILINVDSDTEYEIAAVDYSCWTVVLDGKPLSAEETTDGPVGFSLSGNILSGVLLLSSPGPGHAFLYDITGRQVSDFCLAEGENRLRVGELGPGTYFLRAVSGETCGEFKLLKAD